MLEASVGEGNNLFESTVLYDTNPQILTGLTNVYKMWYTQGWSTDENGVNIGYAESADGLTWTKYGSNPILSDYARGHVIKEGSTYYMFVSGPTTGATRYDDMDLYTSNDGVSFSLDTASVLSVGADPEWDDEQLANVFVWAEGENDYRMLYEAKGASGVWKIGYATASALAGPWTKSGSNPVVDETGMRGGPWVKKHTDNFYYLWCHGSTSGTLPTDIYRYRSTDLVTWTAYPSRPIFTRETADEGEGTSVGQVADPAIIFVGDEFWVYYDASADGSAPEGGLKIKLAQGDESWLYGDY